MDAVLLGALAPWARLGNGLPGRVFQSPRFVAQATSVAVGALRPGSPSPSDRAPRGPGGWRERGAASTSEGRSQTAGGLSTALDEGGPTGLNGQGIWVHKELSSDSNSFSLLMCV